eukprot:Nitzschia sp. Nitz4//scaffold4_size323378//84551//88052//NITZ4_000640-RA/size323378-snap-gene-0.407-mRNA-1//1//CDS//3329553339//6166//frame0
MRGLGSLFERTLANSNYWNATQQLFDENDDFTANFNKAEDVSVDAVVTSILLNSVAFVVLMGTYELLRRSYPSVYSSRIKRQFKAGLIDPDDDPRGFMAQSTGTPYGRSPSLAALETTLPDVSFNWVSSVFNVSWATVRKYSGLDGYFFLRYIRMNLRICGVTAFWALLVLVPVYATGVNQNGEVGWYHVSVANVQKGSWRMWVPSVFAYFFTGFIFFVMKQEYRHFLELRMDFLARGSSHVHPQHHYSLQIENIPYDLRSEKALYDYFDKLFPGKVHSASIVLNLPDLESVKARCLRVCRRLEKSIAYLHATGKRPTHNVGSPRITVLGVDMAPFDFSCGAYPDVAYVDNRAINQRPARGTHVDSISYYSYDLADCNRNMVAMQQRKSKLALTGNKNFEADNWISRLMISANEVADRIMIDSAEDNALRANYTSFDELSVGAPIPQAELMSSRYGSFGQNAGISPRTSQCLPYARQDPPLHMERNEGNIARLTRTLSERALDEDFVSPKPAKTPSAEQLLDAYSYSYSAHSGDEISSGLPKMNDVTLWRRVLGRLGLDFAVAGFKFANKQLDNAMEGAIGATMSSTGFVTFLDLTSVTCAATTPLTSKPQILDVSVAPEPRDIVWNNAHVSAKEIVRRERIVNFFLTLGGFLWIFPLAAIQAFAKAEFIAKIPGMEWILTAGGGSISRFVNGYLPVVAWLTLILILPVIFELVARRYERRKTVSDVQSSMLGRYFYYQVINIYITVTAGSLWRSLADILNHPSNLLELLGESLPTMVGYFVALLVTKILAGLPIVFLRVGALSRMLLLRSLTPQEAKLTQRELDEIYRPENVQYGWEFPAQLLVIMIVFTYAVICPVVLPVGLLYYCFSLIVYKKQVLYVYQPVYESGGAMFPAALQKTLFGLCCGQLTMIGYLITRGFYWQPIFLLPLPVATIWGTGYFSQHYAKPSTRLSLERAREYDRVSEVVALHEVPARELFKRKGAPELGVAARRSQFDKNSYRQPVLTEPPMTPMHYRRGHPDTITEEVATSIKAVQYPVDNNGSPTKDTLTPGQSESQDSGISNREVI